MLNENPQSPKELFARFFEVRSRETLLAFLDGHTGEQSNCDFKENWQEFSCIAKHILGFANSGSGCIIIGVEEKADKTFKLKGLESLQDKADFNNGVHSFLPTRLQGDVCVQDYKIRNKNIQVVFVTSDPVQLPHISTREGKGILPNTIYVRRQGMTDKANDEELQQLINTRIATGYSSSREITLRNHLEELKVLYTELAKWKSLPINQQFALSAGLSLTGCDPYDRFLSETIRIKCHKVQNLLINR
ncbi:MAG TPA: ATP-binding protein [Candidatus Sulfotelmatobacter sp.]|jgi:predicted HTH transcriptional regulator|nr:ATP-binding protein [Candidatus Sulfotelmatobacter sp.]